MTDDGSWVIVGKKETSRKKKLTFWHSSSRLWYTLWQLSHHTSSEADDSKDFPEKHVEKSDFENKNSGLSIGPWMRREARARV
jgi:hypothetical protein